MLRWITSNELVLLRCWSEVRHTERREGVGFGFAGFLVRSVVFFGVS